jgi:DHA1 family bicyclomycin/chloramphenicol resistance-like MFS transporter
MEQVDRDQLGETQAEAQPRMITYVILTAMTVISTTMFLPALPAMQVAFGVSEAVIGLAVTVFMIAAAVLQLVLGPLSDRVGRRPVVLGVLAVYALASLVCLLAQSITLFLLARMVQAVAMTGGILVGAMVRDQHDRKAAAAKLATISSAMAVVPLMAPVLGGYLELTLGWRAIFGFYTLVGAGMLIWAWFDLAETRYAAPAGGEERRMDLLKERRFWAYAATQALGAGGFYVFLVGSPFVVSALYQLDAGQIGIGLGSITLGFMTSAAVSARLVGRFGPFRLIVVGRALALAGLSVGLICFAVTDPPVWLFYGATIWVGIGNGLTLANANALALSVRPRLAGTASGLVGAMGNLVIATLASVTTLALAGAADPVVFFALLIAVVGASLLAVLAGNRWERSAGD